MEFWKVINSRRSVRSFQDKPIPAPKLQKVMSAARWAPSACNEQLWKFIIIKDKTKLKKLVDECGVSKLVLAAPVTVFVFYYKNPFPQNIQSASASVQNILLAATNEGLGSLWIGGSGNSDKIKQSLGVPADYIFICQILLGYAKTEPLPPAKKELNEIISFEKFLGYSPINTHNPDKWTLKDIREHQKYFSSKTDPGREMMIINRDEKSLIKKVLDENYRSGKIADLFSYDGSLLNLFPKKPVSVELSEETAHYISVINKSTQEIFKDKLPFKDNSIGLITILLKLESIPAKDHAPIFKEIHRVLTKGGKLIIVSRKNHSIYSLAYSLIKKFFNDDIRKSGIFTFFGPYQPIKPPVRELKKIGFDVKLRKYYLIPPVIEDYYHLLKQYMKAKNTYLDSVKKRTLLGSLINLSAKATKNIGLFSSTAVIIAKK
jgi:nitroreductase/SAM-dependent methyltransferase